MTKIVVLDALPMNPGDLSWLPMEALGECTIFDRTTASETRSRLAGAEVALTNKVVIDRATMAAEPQLRYIGVMATGYNVVDLEAAKERGIVVTNVPAYSTEITAQGAISLMLELAGHTGLHDASVHAGKWSAQPDFSYWERPLIELSGLTLGIVGLGRIGMRVAQIAAAFGMKVIAASRSQKDSELIHIVPLQQLFREADVISLHSPLTDENRGLINAKTIATMKPTALLINTARGGLVVEEDLAAALNEGRLAGAGVDTLSSEPPSPSNPLLSAKNCIITPHIFWAAVATRQRLMNQITANVKAFLDGTPINVVS